MLTLKFASHWAGLIMPKPTVFCCLSSPPTIPCFCYGLYCSCDTHFYQWMFLIMLLQINSAHCPSRLIFSVQLVSSVNHCDHIIQRFIKHIFTKCPSNQQPIALTNSNEIYSLINNSVLLFVSPAIIETLRLDGWRHVQAICKWLLQNPWSWDAGRRTTKETSAAEKVSEAGRQSLIFPLHTQLLNYFRHQG